MSVLPAPGAGWRAAAAAAALLALALCSWLASSNRTSSIVSGAGWWPRSQPRDSGAGEGARYLVVAAPGGEAAAWAAEDAARAEAGRSGGLLSFGRYSNQRQSLLEALVLARISGRTLLVPRLAACPRTPLHSLFALDARAGGARVQPATATALRAACSAAERVALTSGRASDRLARWLSPFAYAGLAWPVVDDADFSAAVLAMPPLFAHLVTRRAASRAEPVYQHLVTQREPIQMGFGSAALPWWLAQYAPANGAASCALIETPFFAVNLATLPGELEEAVLALAPAAVISQAVLDWYSARDLEPLRVVAIHARMTDMVSRDWSQTNAACLDAVTAGHEPAAFALMSAFIASWAGANLPVVLASDDFASPCAVALARHFANRTRLVLFSPDDVSIGQSRDDCVNAQLVQEVLALSAVFIGSKESSFSAAINQIRVVRHAQAHETTLLLE